MRFKRSVIAKITGRRDVVVSSAFFALLKETNVKCPVVVVLSLLSISLTSPSSGPEESRTRGFYCLYRGALRALGVGGLCPPSPMPPTA